MAVSPLAAEPVCPLCRSRQCVELIDRPHVPVLMNRFYPTRSAAWAAACGHLRVVFCTGCGFAFNSRYDPALVVYDGQYENNQAGSACFIQHLAEVKGRLLRILGESDARVLEIGCGQGEMIESLAVQGAGRIEAIGCDTVWRPRQLSPGLRIESAEFDAAAMRETGAFDIVYSRHVIEHVDDPVALLRAMASVLGDSGRVCIETPDLDWILANNQRQDFFYEHCNYFTATSLTEACRRAGLGAVQVERLFGGQYLWAEARIAAATPQIGPIISIPQTDGDFFARWRAWLIARPGPGTVAVWGAGAKGVTFAVETDPTAELIACLIDINPNKQGQFTPRSGHRVLDPAVASDLGIDEIVVMNPNYHDEIARMAACAGLHARLLMC
jgi:SAM-dependent methyltransferase